MRGLSTAVFGGGGATISVCMMMQIFLLNANYEDPMVVQFLEAAGAAGWVILLLGVGCIVTTVLGVMYTRKEGAWPHWRRLVRGLGEGAFLVGIFSACRGMILGFNEIARLGATIGPADLSDGLGLALVGMALGTLVALVSLFGAGVLLLVDKSGGVAHPVAIFPEEK